MAKQHQHADGVEGVNVSGKDAPDSLKEAYGVTGTGNGKFMFGAYEGSTMFASSKDPPIMLECDDRIGPSISSNFEAHSNPSASGPRNNANVSTDNMNTATATNKDNSANSDESGRMKKLQDGESFTLFHLQYSATHPVGRVL